MSAEPLATRTMSDTVGGYVVAGDGSRIRVRTFGGDVVSLHLTDSTDAWLLPNLGAERVSVTGRLGDELVPGRLIFAYGPAYVEAGSVRHTSQEIVVVGSAAEPYLFERPGWWVDQLRSLAGFYRRAQFGTGPADFAAYRTGIDLAGARLIGDRQETDTLARLVYGMATAYLLTGDADFLDVAERGAEYQQRHLRVVDPERAVTYWQHALDVGPGPRRAVLASEFGDDAGALAAYEQIYALVGLVQTYRVTGDPALLADIEGTVRLFETVYADPRRGGYYSHVDPVELDPHAASLGPNRSRKNWNSVGDHAPAYLFNLYLATGEERYRRMLEHTFDMIVEHFPDPTGLPLVRERFHEDWTPDTGWGWQQDRSVVGHNLKIVWNLHRMQALVGKAEYRAVAARLAADLPAIGRDPYRGGWYDVLHRRPHRGRHEFVWHDRKAWWQQEQAILAYLSGAAHHGSVGPGGLDYLRHAREAAAFYNAFFLDQEAGGVYFAVQAGGIPYLRSGDERAKGSHSMSMYHSAELAYLATVYGDLLVRGEPLDLWFNPRSDARFPDGLLRVAPDVLPRGRVRLERVRIDGTDFTDFDPAGLLVRLPRSAHRLTVQATLRADDRGR
ncbi:AGE family epimerase/isomerase [Micromonospora sp. WMMD734]|uniref:AGE family epimerase/isomerase n=1 Tax=Micromonospora sp. WMMD734 TaxID=3404129 RepID=UPI003B936518